MEEVAKDDAPIHLMAPVKSLLMLSSQAMDELTLMKMNDTQMEPALALTYSGSLLTSLVTP